MTAITVEDIANAAGNLNLLNKQIKELEAARDAAMVNLAIIENARVLFGVSEDRDAEAFRAQMLELADETKTPVFRERMLQEWVKTIDSAFTFRGWGIDNDRDELFPDFGVEVPKEITDDFVRNVNFFTRIVNPVQPARLRITNEAFMMAYQPTNLNFDGAKLENAFTACGTSRSGTSQTRPLLATLRIISERAFSSWNTEND